MSFKFEDCTKDELIYLLRNTTFFDADRSEFDVLMYRADAASTKRRQESEAALNALQEYIEILRPFRGKPMKDIPDEVINRAAQAERRYAKRQRSAQRLDKQYCKIQEQIDHNLAGRECDR